MLYNKFLKRLLDFSISLIALIVLLPVLLVIALLIKLKLGGPVIFKQKRPGINGEIFEMYKFRTMTNEKDSNGNFLPDERRLNKFGKTLRSSSLDELPELWNVLIGDMALIGPRPQLVRDLVFMNEFQKRRHIVKPGITGLAQINGRNNISWDDKLNFDIEYISDLSFKLDFKIFILTFIKVIKKENVNTDGMETAEDFGDYLLRKKVLTKQRYVYLMKESERLING